MFRRVSDLIEESYCVLVISLHLLQGASHGWAHDLSDRVSKAPPARIPTPRVMNRTTPDTSLMEVILGNSNLHEAKRAVTFIKHEANLLSIATDGSVNRQIRILAVSRLTSVGTLLAIAFGHEVDLAHAAASVIRDQMALSVILLHSPFVSLRRLTASLCDEDDALLKAEALDEDDDVRWLASLRFARLASGVCMIHA